MIDTVKALPGLIKDWKTNSDLIYQLIGCVAGLLTIAAYTGQQRPSEVMAGLTSSVGATGIAEWFESGLPPFVAQPDTHTSRMLVIFAGVAVLALLVRPFFNARRDDWPIDLQARGILGARAACTTWALLMLAAQFESLAWVAAWLRSQAITVVVVISLIALMYGLLFLAALKLELYHLIDAAGGWIVQGLASVGAVLIMTVIALAFAVIGPVLSIVSWLLATESDAYVETKRQVTQELASGPLPTVAAPPLSQPSRSASDLAA